MSKKHPDQLSKVLREKASVVISDVDHPGGLNVGEILAWRRWFSDRQRQLQSSGGRPTNPRWTLKRQVPFSKDTWQKLEERANGCSESGSALGPGQLAAFLLEDAVAAAQPPSDPHALDNEAGTWTGDESPYKVDDPRFTEWEMPGPFVGAGNH